MAKTDNPYGFRGTVNGLTYYKRGNQWYVRKKSSLTGERFMEDPCFEKPREAGERFGIASNAGKAIRWALAPFDQAFSDNALLPRLAGAIVDAMEADNSILVKNKINFMALAPALKAFNFVEGVNFGSAMHLKYDYKYKPETQTIEFIARPYADDLFIKAPGITHARYHLIVAVLGKAITRCNYDPQLDLAQEATWSSEWEHATGFHALEETITIPSFLFTGKPLIVALAIESGIKDGPNYYPCQKGKCMQILDII